MKYVVIEKGWEYNDEIYYRAESGGGIPMKVFKDKHKADTWAREQNIKCVRGQELCSFYYDLEDILGNVTEEYFKNFYSRIFSVKDCNVELFQIPKDAPAEDIGRVLDLLNPEFMSFEVWPVEDGPQR